MSDPFGFLKYQRQELKYRSKEERLRDWNEVAHSKVAYDKIGQQARRCMDCGVPFCQSETGCPVDNLIPEWTKLVTENRWEEAFHRLHRTNNFPEFTGSLCPAPCESACVLGLNSDPVAIKNIEWSIIDRGFQEGWVRPQINSKKTGFKVAIVGSGPAGLAAAQELARKGHHVTVFEKNTQVGGLLRYGIPDFKFEKWRLDRRIKQLSEEGVEFRTSVEVGKDFSFKDLQNDFHAVGLALGAEKPRDLMIPGRELQGICFAMDYLTDQNKLIANEISELKCSAQDKDVVIIGGGDTGSDCVGTALRQGAKSVTQLEIMPRPPSERSSETPWPLWPLKLRTSHAHEEGGSRYWSVLTTRFEGDGTNVQRLVAEKVEYKNGKFEKIASEPELVLKTDLVILALGFTGANLEGIIPQSHDFSGGKILTKSLGQTSIDGVFAAGDVSRGASLIVWAISEGRKMATGIDKYLANTIG